MPEGGARKDSRAHHSSYAHTEMYVRTLSLCNALQTSGWLGQAIQALIRNIDPRLLKTSEKDQKSEGDMSMTMSNFGVAVTATLSAGAFALLRLVVRELMGRFKLFERLATRSSRRRPAAAARSG